MMKWGTLVFLVTAAFPLFMSAQIASSPSHDTKNDFIQLIGSAKINWTTGYISVTGNAAPDLKAKNVAVARLGAQRAAKLDAMRNLLEAVKGVKINSATTLENSMETSIIIKSEIDGVVKGLEILSTKYFSDGGVDVIAQIPLTDIIQPVADAASGSSGPVPIVIPPAVKPAVASSTATLDSLVLNARGRKLLPVVYPVIYDEKGMVLYDSSMLSPAAKKQGGAWYVKDDMPPDLERLGTAPVPLTVTVVDVKDGVNPVVDKEGAAAIRTKLMKEALTQGRVCIIVK